MYVVFKVRCATVAQLVEYDLAKVGVAGSSPVCRLVEKVGSLINWLPAFFYCSDCFYDVCYNYSSTKG